MATPQETGAQKIKNKSQERNGSGDSEDSLRDLPECLEEFADTHASRDSGSVRPTKVGSNARKRSLLLTSRKTDFSKYA